MSNGRPWTLNELATLRRMARARYSDGEISREIKRHPKCVGEKRRELRIERGHSEALQAIMARLNLRGYRARMAA